MKVKVTRDKKRYFSALPAASVRFMFGKTSVASSFGFHFELSLVIDHDMWCVVELNEARQHASVTSEVTKTTDLSTSQQPDAEWKTGNLANLFFHIKLVFTFGLEFT